RAGDRNDAVGNEKITRVRRGDAVTLGKKYDLLHQLFLLAVGANLIKEVADLAARPQIFDEALVVHGFLGEIDLIDEFLGLHADAAGKGNGRVAIAGEPAHDNNLIAVEEV